MGGAPLRSAVFSVLFACLICATPAFASGGATITQPANGATVSGLVTISLIADSGVQWSNFYIDGNYYASTPPLTITWDSTKVPNGTHTISAIAYSANKTVMGNPSITVSVANSAPGLKLTSPISGSQVSGTITISANQPTGVQWENFYVDGGWIASSPPYSFSWNTNQVANGAHTISVNSYGSSGKMGTYSLSVTVANGAIPTATPTVAPTTVATVAPTIAPTSVPTLAPTKAPTVAPTAVPTVAPPLSRLSRQPLSQRSRQPLSRRSRQPLSRRSRQPLSQRSHRPLFRLSRQPLFQRSHQPLFQRSHQPLFQRLRQPLFQRSRQPLFQRSRQPRSQLSYSPRRQPAYLRRRPLP